MNRRKILAGVLCTVAFSAAVLGGCNKSESTPDEAGTSPTGVSASAEIPATAPVTTDAKNIEIDTQAPLVTDTEYFEVPAYDSNLEQNEEPQPCTVNVDGKAYTFYTGDIFSYAFYLKTPEALEDFQAVTNYDSGMLELVKADLDEMFPVARGAVICNADMPSVIKYNAVNIKGMDFTKGGNLVLFKFRVIDSGGTAISTTLEYMDSVKSEPYVSDYRIVGDITYSEEII